VRRRPVQKRSRERFEAIVQGARQLIGERGLEPVTMTDIAAAAGMNVTALYRYFPNKRAVVRELALRAFEANAEMAKELTRAEGHLSSAERIRRGVAHYIRHHLDDAGRLQVRRAVRADAELSALDLRDSVRNAEVIAAELHRLGTPIPVAVLRRRCLLIVEAIDGVIRLASGLEEEADALVDEFAAAAAALVLRGPSADDRPRGP
jgi:AcrR family transcriptional regulator